MAGVLRDERVKRGISVKSLSEKSGVSRQVIGNFENGVQVPILANVSKIIAGLGVKFSEITVQAEDRLEKGEVLPAKAKSRRL